MVDKRFSDFTPKPELDDDDIVPTETAGVGNNRTSYKELKTQIQDAILSQYGRQSVGRIVHLYSNHVAGVPQGYDVNLIYADGSQHQRTESVEIANFIDYAKVIPTLKELYQIPDSGDYFVVPDLRNKHIVGVGDINPPFSNIVSKTLNPQTVVTTSVLANGNHSHGINDITGSFGGGGDQDAAPRASNAFGNGSFYITAGRSRPMLLRTGGSDSEALYNFSSHRAGVTKTNDSGSHSHTATNSVGYTDINIFDNVVRVPAVALFTFLDIAINDIYINPIVDINIGDVNGLQQALQELDNDKLDNVVFDGFLLDYVDDLDAKLSVNDFIIFEADNNLALASKLPVATFNTTFRSSWNSVRRTGLAVAINNSTTVGRNIVADLQNVATTNTGGVDYLGDQSATAGYPTVTNSTTAGNYRLPIITGLTAYRVGITIRVTGTFANQQDQKDLFAEIRLANGTTSITTTNLRRSIPNDGNPLVGKFEPIRVTSTTDILTTLAGGFQILLYNDNSPSSTYTMNTIELVFKY